MGGKSIDIEIVSISYNDRRRPFLASEVIVVYIVSANNTNPADAQQDLSRAVSSGSFIESLGNNGYCRTSNGDSNQQPYPGSNSYC